VPEKSYAWLFYWLFHYVCILWLGVTLHDLTTLCGSACDKTAVSQHPASHFLISSVLCKEGNDNYEQWVHWGEFGSSVWMRRQHRSDESVMTPFQQWFEKPCLCTATLLVWEKVCLFWVIWRILLGAVDQKQMFDHKRDLVMKSFWPVFVVELSDTDMRLCNKACASFSEWFLVALSHGKVLFSDECAVYCSSLSWNVVWG